MKIILPILAVVVLSNCANGQTTAVDNFIADTATYTIVESTLRQNNVPQKVEYLEPSTIGGINLGIILIHNLNTKAVTKGIYISNGWISGYNIFTSQRGNRAYIDEDELEDVVAFLDSCNNVWKNEHPQPATSYELETKDKFRIRFASYFDGNWRFLMQFRSYYFFNLDKMSKNRSANLYGIFKHLLDTLKAY